MDQVELEVEIALGPMIEDGVAEIVAWRFPPPILKRLPYEPRPNNAVDLFLRGVWRSPVAGIDPVNLDALAPRK